jgi:hypothetical protein
MSPLRHPPKAVVLRPLAHRGPDPARLTVCPGQTSHKSYRSKSRSKSYFKGEAKSKYTGRPHGAFAAISEVLRDQHSARACSNGRPSDRLRFFMCRLVLCGSSAGQYEKKKRPPPSRQRATWLAACRRREKRPSSSTRQANKAGRMSRRASRI